MKWFSEDLLGFQNNWHHDEWCGLLDGSYIQNEFGQVEPLPYGSMSVYNKWIMLEAPRSHAKSTLFTVNYPLWEVCRNRNIRIIIVTAAGTQSEAFLREITTQLERNDKIKAEYGNIVPALPEKWTQREIIVVRSKINMKDPTVSATSTGGVVLSRRADIIICDDILSKDNTRTFEQREKTREWFFQVLLPVLEPDGRLIVVGTAWNGDDLYQQLLGTNQFNVRVVYDAILDDDKKAVLWPERWSWDILMALKKAMGSQSFNLAYRNQVQAAEDAIFQAMWLNDAKARGKHRRLIQRLDYSNWDMGKVMVSQGVDLAISKKKDSDDTAMAVVGRTSNGMKIPLYLLVKKLSPAETRSTIRGLAERYNPDIIVVENNAYQKAIELDMIEETDLPIVGYTTGGEKFDIDIGINSMAVGFENGKWILPYDSDDPYTIKMVDMLVDGMLRFGSGHTEDLLMALWMADNGFRQLMGEQNEGGLEIVGQVRRADTGL